MSKHFTELGLPTPGNARRSETWMATMVKRIHDRLYGRGLYPADLFDDA